MKEENEAKDEDEEEFDEEEIKQLIRTREERMREA